MIVGLGIDLVELERIEAILERYGRRFLEKILTPVELETLPPRPLSYAAARFAAKEAGAKALGTGFAHGVGLHDFEVRRLPSGQPELVLHGAAAARGAALGAERVYLSLSHSKSTAGAVVILEGR